MMTYLILGSNSFAGSSFVNYLLSKEETVVGVSRSSEAHPVLLRYFTHPRQSAFKFIQCDINHDIKKIIEIVGHYKPQYIVDFAGQGMVAESWSDPAQWYLTNIVSKVKLHQYLKDCDFLQRYVRVSTPEVYGNSQTNMKETHPNNPSTPYAVSHSAIDLSLQAFYKQYQFPVILTRFANFYGPHQQLYRIIPRTMIYGLLNKKLPLHGGGLSERMFIYSDDVSEGIYRAIQKGNLGDIYHFSSGPCITIRSLVEKICDLMNINQDALIEIAEERAGKDNKYEMDFTKARAQLNWEPQVSLEKGLENTLRWVRNNIDMMKTLPLNYIHKQ